MIKLRTLVSDDVDAIRSWPPYPMEFECMDYALRSKGWLHEYMEKENTWCFAAQEGQELVAFTILSKTGPDEAEFRIALRADKVGQGLGRTVSAMTLSEMAEATEFDRHGRSLPSPTLCTRKKKPDTC